MPQLSGFDIKNRTALKRNAIFLGIFGAFTLRTCQRKLRLFGLFTVPVSVAAGSRAAHVNRAFDIDFTDCRCDPPRDIRRGRGVFDFDDVARFNHLCSGYGKDLLCQPAADVGAFAVGRAVICLDKFGFIGPTELINNAACILFVLNQFRLRFDEGTVAAANCNPGDGIGGGRVEHDPRSCLIFLRQNLRHDERNQETAEQCCKYDSAPRRQNSQKLYQTHDLSSLKHCSYVQNER